MAISDYQISSIIKTYTDNMRAKIRGGLKNPTNTKRTETGDIVSISEEGRKRLFEKIEENIIEKIRRNES